MSYFNNKLNILEYMRMTQDYDGTELLKLLEPFLRPGCTLLEIGMGPGKDLDLLKETYTVTGSDLSDGFLELYRDKNPDADLLQLDAVTLDTERTFEAVFSNKVLHHLDRKDLRKSFQRQYEILEPEGIAAHTFWFGDKIIEVKGMTFYYYTEETIRPLIDDLFEVVFWKNYMEMDTDDSILLIMKKHPV
jgi:cyclopropane fatty-acyl-phospholipid synthase-like methyltransferase